MKILDKKFEWTEEVDQAFAHILKVLATPLIRLKRIYNF
jgi:hypothetical protein